MGFETSPCRPVPSGLTACLLLAVQLLLALAGCASTEGGLAPAPTTAPTAAALQDALRDEFVRLGIDPARQPAAVVSGEANAVFDLDAVLIDPDGEGPDPPTGVLLSWTESAIGDYNRDGLVSVSDLTPIGQQFEGAVAYRDPPPFGIEHWPEGDPDADGTLNWYLARVDGNRDGLVHIHDLTPIAQHWNERLDGYRVYLKIGLEDYALVPNPDDAGSPLTIPRVLAVQGVETPVRYFFELSDVPTEPVLCYVAPYDGETDTEGPASRVIVIMGLSAPEAHLEIVPTDTGPIPLSVHFDATGSTDNGEIVSYDWDFDADGDFELLGGGAEPLGVFIYNVPGDFPISVRVTDDEGLEDTATATVHATYRDWHIQQLETEVVTDRPIALAMIDGHPAVSFLGTDESVKYQRANDELGIAGWARPAVVSPCGPHGRAGALGEVHGRPALTFYNSDAGELRYVRADDAVGGAWSAPPVAVFSIVSTGVGQCSMAMVADNPAVAFETIGGDTNTYYERAVDMLGANWGTASIEIDGSHRGAEPSLAVIDGRPAVAYYRTDSDPRMLGYVRAVDAEGSAPWEDPVIVHSDPLRSAGGSPTLLDVFGQPAIGCITQSDAAWEPMYLRAGEATGMAGDWNDPAQTLVVDGGYASQTCSLALISGKPQIALFNYGGRQLCHVWSFDMEGAEWSTPVVVDDGGEDGNVGWGCVMIDVSGRPGIAYMDVNAGALKYAVMD